MRREIADARARRMRARRRPFWAAIGIAGCFLLAAAVWAGAGGPPPWHPPGAGLPPDILRASPEADDRAAEIAAEEARLANLRLARMRLQQEVAALREEAEQRRRDAPAAHPAEPAPPPPEPIARGLRVFVHHRTQSAGGAGAASEVAQLLRAAGVEVPAIRAAPFVPSTPVVRYFHDEDQAAAARLAGRLGRGWAIQDFRAFVPQPPPQTLEVWLPAN